MKTFLEKILEYYDITLDDYNALCEIPNLENIGSPYDFLLMDETCKYVKEAIDNNKKILIYGDYDCDGIMATSIIFNTLKQYKDYKAGFYIPNREIDGYGITKENIERFHKLNYDIIICVDNGITLIDEIDYLNSLSMECLIFDHHTPKEQLPKAKYILHPSISKFSDINMSAGEVCYYFSRAFLGINDEYLLTLAMLSTLSDMMEIKGKNRELVRLGLEALNKNKYKNITLLMRENEEINEEKLSLGVIPKINAVGRIVLDNNLYNIVRFFTTDTESDFPKRVEWIEEINKKRKMLVDEAYLNKEKNCNDNSFVSIEEIPEGLCGLLANKYLDKFNKPVVIFSKCKKEGVLKGSIRSRNGFNVIQVFDVLSDLLITSGGHAFAGGLSIYEKDFDNFKERFDLLAKENPFGEDVKKTIVLNLSEINLNNYNILTTFAPFGYGHEMPTFEIDSFNTDCFTYSRNHLHIMTSLGISSNLVYFNFPSEIVNYKFVKLYGKLTKNRFLNKISCQFIVNSFEKKQ